LELEYSPNSQGGAWDQFTENERLFGLKTDYDAEHLHSAPQ